MSQPDQHDDHALRSEGRFDRRTMMKGAAASAVAGAVAARAGGASHAQGGSSQMSNRSSSRTFVQGGDAPGVESMSVADLQAALGNGEMTVRELVQACLDRIAELDEEGPALNAVIELNPDALAIADELDAELEAGTPHGPFHGIPVLIKDNIATADGMETSAGSLALVGIKPVEDSTIARLLREAGAVILGKTNLSEWANIRSFQSTSGWSGRGGQTLNPYQLDRNPSGSSSGSAVAVAAGYVPVAIGTETNGSIVSPAGHCGVVGIKPTVGLVSRYGVIPISHSQDTAGPMARTVADAAALLNILAVQDDKDPAQEGPSFEAAGGAASTASPAASPVPEDEFPVYPPKPEGGVPVIDYTAELDPAGLRGARIGVLRSAVGFSPLADQVFDEVLAAIREAGAEVIDPVEMPSAEEISSTPDGLELLLWELKADLAAYFTQMVPVESPIRSLADVIAFNEAHPEEEMPYFDQSLFLLAEAKTGLDDPEYIAAASRLQQMGRKNGIDAVLREYRLDAIVAPTNAPSTKIDLVNGDHFLGGSSTPAAIAGYPLVTVTAGYRFGLPIGITFMGTAYSEATLVKLAYAFEQQVGVWQAPEFTPGSVVPPADREGNERDATPAS